MYFGIVKNINDPLKLGRVKVNVFKCHDNIKTKDLSWSQVMMPGNTPAISGQGHSVNLAEEILWKEGEVLPNGVTVGDVKVIGSLVCGIFLDNKQQEFMVMGSLPTKTDSIEDNNVRVRAEANPHADEPKGDYQPASTYAPEYPYNNVFETASGHVKEYDDTEGHERITERHMSGTQYEIQPDGTKNETIVRDNYRLVVGHDTLEVFGNVRIIVSGQADIAVANDVNLAVGGNLAADVTGNMTANITGTTSLIGIGDISVTQNGIDSSLITIKSEYIKDDVLYMGNIKLDGEVNITGNLLVDKATTTNLTTTTSNSSNAIELDTHIHEYTEPQHAGDTVDTSIPNP